MKDNDRTALILVDRDIKPPDARVEKKDFDRVKYLTQQSLNREAMEA